MANAHHVLLLGGHGKVAQLLTPLLLRRGWAVTSVIRNPDQKAAVEALAQGAPAEARLTVLVHSLEDVRGVADAQAVLERVRPDYVVWSAGAGGKGAPERTRRVDEEAAVAFVEAAAAVTTSPAVTRFLLVSYTTARRAKAAWWDDASWAQGDAVNRGPLARYYEAKVRADEALYRAGRRRGPGFAAVDLRPSRLTDEPAGPVEIGRTARAVGTTSRATVAAVADLLLAHPHTRSAWIDVLDGAEDAAAGVDRVVREGIDAVEGEPVTREEL